MQDLEVIRRLVKESVNRDHYDLMYTLQLFMSGDADAIEQAIDGRVLDVSWKGGDDVLPKYPEILPRLGPNGLQNHGLLNARINLQGLSMEPEITFLHEDPVIREYNAAFFRTRADEQSWSQDWMQCGFEVEANGYGSCHAGVSEQRVAWKHTPNLDLMFDRTRRSPGQWRWICVRNILTPEDALETYGNALSKTEIEEITRTESGAAELSAPSGYTGSARKVAMRQVTEWSYYDRDHHVVFLSRFDGDASITLKLNDDYEYVKAESAGPNPFGTLPHAWWIDSWAPGVLRPVSKMETTIRIAAMLNEVEACMVEVVRNTPLTTVNTSRLRDPQLVDDIMDATSFRRLRKIIPVNGSVKDVIERTEMSQIPPVLLHMRQILKEELNAATGVQDMQRGQALGGERTRYEVESFNDQAGVQARHMRRTFAEFLEGVVRVTRAIAAQHDTAESTIVLPTYGSLSTREFPVAQMMALDIPVKVNPNSLVFKTEEQRQQEAMVLFTSVMAEGMNRGVLNPAKVFDWTLRHFGFKDPMKELGFTPQEQAQMAMMAQQQALAGAASEQNSANQ